MKKIFSLLTVIGCLTIIGFVSCSEANEFEDTITTNPSWANATHPESLAGTKYVRGTGIKTNAYGQDVQGFVESLDFVSADSVAVVMSQGVTEGTMNDESNTERVPYYEYTYTDVSGKFEILKREIDDNKKVSKKVIFMGTALTADKDIIVISHFNDMPSQTYLVKQ